jgi:hypothetical protein
MTRLKALYSCCVIWVFTTRLFALRSALLPHRSLKVKKVFIRCSEKKGLTAGGSYTT